MPSDRQDLIEKLEKASEGSRKLDYEIFDFLKGPSKWEAPHYTTSLDSALSLVPEGMWWSIEANDTPNVAVFPKVLPPDFRHVYLYELACGDSHKNLALALTIAALKAQESG